MKPQKIALSLVIILISCNHQHDKYDKINHSMTGYFENGLYCEEFTTLESEDGSDSLLAVYITDSLNFRVFIEEYNSKADSFPGFTISNDTVYVFRKYSRNGRIVEGDIYKKLSLTKLKWSKKFE